MIEYADFLAGKSQWADRDGFEPDELPSWLYDFQADTTAWALRCGRAAILSDCGTGKGPMELAWASAVQKKTREPVLIVTPLAVSAQLEREAFRFGLDAEVSRDGRVLAPITITNYERLHYFDTDRFGGVACDESSILKSFDGVTRAAVTEFLRRHRYRLLASATAAPNDFTELGTSSEALGHLGYMDMLNRFFTNDQHTIRPRAGALWRKVSDWRFKGHAEEAFWQWMCSWARAFRRPSDLGFDDEGFDLPPLEKREHVVSAQRPRNGALFDLPAVTLNEQREEDRHTLRERCEKAAELLSGPEPGVSWCHLNAEGDLLTRLMPGAVQIKGSDSPEAKEEALLAFSRGDVTHLVTKPSIAGWGLNWQHCHRLTYFPSHSYELFYQAVRRFWRYGQMAPVTLDIVTTEGGVNVMHNLERKAEQADRMFDQLTAHMRDALSVRRSADYAREVEVPTWLSASN